MSPQVTFKSNDDKAPKVDSTRRASHPGPRLCDAVRVPYPSHWSAPSSMPQPPVGLEDLGPAAPARRRSDREKWLQGMQSNDVAAAPMGAPSRGLPERKGRLVRWGCSGGGTTRWSLQRTRPASTRCCPPGQALDHGGLRTSEPRTCARCGTGRRTRRRGRLRAHRRQRPAAGVRAPAPERKRSPCWRRCASAAARSGRGVRVAAGVPSGGGAGRGHHPDRGRASTRCCRSAKAAM